jgi:hypothetical protein
MSLFPRRRDFVKRTIIMTLRVIMCAVATIWYCGANWCGAWLRLGSYRERFTALSNNALSWFGPVGVAILLAVIPRALRPVTPPR